MWQTAVQHRRNVHTLVWTSHCYSRLYHFQCTLKRKTDPRVQVANLPGATVTVRNLHMLVGAWMDHHVPRVAVQPICPVVVALQGEWLRGELTIPRIRSTCCSILLIPWRIPKFPYLPFDSLGLFEVLKLYGTGTQPRSLDSSLISGLPQMFKFRTRPFSSVARILLWGGHRCFSKGLHLSCPLVSSTLSGPELWKMSSIKYYPVQKPLIL